VSALFCRGLVKVTRPKPDGEGGVAESKYDDRRGPLTGCYRSDEGHGNGEEVQEVSQSDGPAVDAANEIVLGHPVEDGQAEVESSRSLD